MNRYTNCCWWTDTLTGLSKPVVSHKQKKQKPELKDFHSQCTLEFILCFKLAFVSNGQQDWTHTACVLPPSLQEPHLWCWLPTMHAHVTWATRSVHPWGAIRPDVALWCFLHHDHSQVLNWEHSQWGICILISYIDLPFQKSLTKLVLKRLFPLIHFRN